MVFITIRDDYIPSIDEGGLERLAQNYQQMFVTGGVHVNVVNVEDNQMIAIANDVRELIEIRKMALNQEAVLKIEHDKKSFPGKYITEEERLKHNLRKMPNDDL